MQKKNKNRRIIGIRHRYNASHFGPALPPQVCLSENTRSGMHEISFQLKSEEEERRFLAQIIRKGDRIAMSGSRRADALAYAVAHRAHEVGATVHRIPTDDLRDHMLLSRDDASKVLANTLRFQSIAFTEVTPRQVRIWRAKHKLDQRSLDL